MSTNPFAAPQPSPFAQPPSAPAFKPIDGIQYLRMYNYVFENPNWVMNVLLTAVCALIPVIGPLLLLGYQYEIMIGLLMSGGTRYPDFDFNRFTDYLLRGLWPFLVGLVAALIIVPVLLVVILPMFFLMAAAGSNEDIGPAVFLIGMPIFFLVNIVISIAIQMLLMPLQMRAGLSQDFAAAFNLQWVLEFVKKTWLEMCLGLLFVSFGYLILGILGLAVFCVGVYAAMALYVMAHGHMLYQLYVLFLSRGGQAVAIKMSQPK